MSDDIHLACEKIYKCAYSIVFARKESDDAMFFIIHNDRSSAVENPLRLMIDLAHDSFPLLMTIDLHVQ